MRPYFAEAADIPENRSPPKNIEIAYTLNRTATKIQR
jgi:hypothetical protein